MARKMHQNRDEGLYGDSYELDLADYRGLINSSGLSYSAIARKATPPLHPSTVANIADGTTARPQDSTIKAILKVLGFRRPFVHEDIAVAAEMWPKQYWPEGILERRRKARLERRKKRKLPKQRGRAKYGRKARVKG